MNIYTSETEYLKTEVQRLSALVRAQQITIDKLEAQPEQEPVAYKTMSKIGKAVGYWRSDLMPRHISSDSHEITPLYTTPPQRKPLTDEELETMAEKYVTNCYFDTLEYARAIEAAHGIKENT